MEDTTGQSNSQEFCLRWNNFHASLISALDGFKNDQDFVDVTLACEGQFLKAHKMLLSACSVFFRDLLKANPCQHPIVILPPEVRFGDLEKLLRFIYQGEVNVQQEHLARFLKTAEMLKIRGLAEDSEKQKVLRSSSPRPPESGESDSFSPKRPRLSIDVQQSSQDPHTPNDDSRLSADSDSEMIPVKQEMVELKECAESLYEGDADSFIPEAYLRESNSSNPTLNNQSSSSSSLPNAPPPPGPLQPSYVPPPQVKTQDDSPLGLPPPSDELSQGTFARLVADHLGSAGSNTSGNGGTPLNKSSGPQGKSPGTTKRSPIQVTSINTGPSCTTKSPGQIHWTPGLPWSPASPSIGIWGKVPPLYSKGSQQQTPTVVRSGVTTPSTPTGRSPSVEVQPSSVSVSPLGSLVPVLSSGSPTGCTSTSGNISGRPNISNISTCSNYGGGGGPGLMRSTSLVILPTKEGAPLTCDICFKSFTSRSNLNKHKRVQHSGEEYVCPICRRAFRNRYYIKEHVLLCSTATTKKELQAVASCSATVSGSLVGGTSAEDSRSTEDLLYSTQEYNGEEADDKPTDLAIRRPASPT